MDDASAIEWIRGDAAEMAALLRQMEPDQPVPACPGWNASDLSRHVAAGFAAWYAYNISTPADMWSPKELMSQFATVGDDFAATIDSFEAGAAEFLDLCATLDRTQPTWSFGGVEPAGWWIRRAGTELTVHLTDAAGVLGRRASTAPEAHCEAIDELTSQIMPKLRGLMAFMNQLTGEWSGDVPPIPDRPAALVAEDAGRAWTLFRTHEGQVGQAPRVRDDAGAIGRGSSADLLAWLHGRPMDAPLVIEGNAQLLHDWNLFERAQD